LRDAWLVAGNAQARDVLVRLSDWCQVLTDNLFDEQMQRMLDVEPGGMNEVLADVCEITGNKKYLALAKRFSHRKLLDPLLARQDPLDGLHANMQIPKVTGFARVGELADDPAWIDAARFFWENVTTKRLVAIGGTGVASHFHPVNDFSRMINMRAGPEACATHNMLRLTEQLYRLQPEARYIDYYERALVNNILSSQHPLTGALAYHTGVRPRDFRTYSRAARNAISGRGTDAAVGVAGGADTNDDACSLSGMGAAWADDHYDQRLIVARECETLVVCGDRPRVARWRPCGHRPADAQLAGALARWFALRGGDARAGGDVGQDCRPGIRGVFRRKGTGRVLDGEAVADRRRPEAGG
jgi:hypothetical protein